VEDFISKLFLLQCRSVRDTTTAASDWERMCFGRPALETCPSVAVGWWEGTEQLTKDLPFVTG